MGCFASTNTSKEKSGGKGSSNLPKQLVNTNVQTKADVKQLRQCYNINPKVLGSGSFGKVFLAENKQDTSHVVAIKVIHKAKLKQDEIDAIKNEVAIL